MITPAQMEIAKHYIRTNLRAIRKSKGLTPYEFAKEIGIGRETINRIEKGKVPTMLTAYKLIDALDLKQEITQ